MPVKKFSVSDRSHLEKKTKINPRFNSIRPKVFCGLNVNVKLQALNEIKKYYKVRNTETFQRINLVELLQLIVVYTGYGSLADAEQAKFMNTQKTGSNLHVIESGEFTKNIPPEHLFSKEMLDYRSNLQCPVLLLDIRSSEKFEEGHILSALSYPLLRLSRTVRWEAREMVAYKNKADTLIVVYDEDESIAPEAVSVLNHRGYDNAVMLSGGLKLIRDKVGSPLVVPGKRESLFADIGAFLVEKFPFLKMQSVASWNGLGWGFRSVFGICPRCGGVVTVKAVNQSRTRSQTTTYKNNRQAFTVHIP